MEGFSLKYALALLVIGLLAFVIYLWKLNQALRLTPPDVLALSPNRWTDQKIKETYQKIKNNPISWAEKLPPKLNRRYIVTGGSGGVGGQIILHLLERGQSPESIRNVDFRAPERRDMQSGPAAAVPFIHADISSASSTNAAFSAAWPDSVAKLPLTVFHVAAVIVPHERSMALFERVKRVNIDGTENVLNASKAVGTDVFIATSSSSVALVPVQYWGIPWKGWPRNFVQAVDESDFDKPLKKHEQFFSNYGHAKAVAERLVCNANSPNFRTGVVRPGNGIYGNSHGDQLVGALLRAEVVPTWTRNIYQNCVHIGHVSLGHLLFEAALASNAKMPQCAGRPFLITDPGAAPLFQDYYRLLQSLAITPVKVIPVPPAVMLLLAYVVEAFDSLSQFPGFKWAKPKGDLAMLQPSIFSAATHVPILDAAAKKSVAEGGLGYKGVCTTMEGMCQQLLDWNMEHENRAHERNDKPLATVAQSARNVATVPAAVKG
ncbi:hypothetical protein BKA67DRAFT_594100 [Truncatella angustata]|uniref:3-beta hydroxysteroid dehydrogenase/isomerase domain-containing protein n=1 Tax=Truncatella angustata TaxID=152316 RepID=A0A9P8UEW1_9PEZI|nr:uncharacterized protein BKA67DRAFT_594100 [Truncatella angustata]KAH6648573.1 hypothetical protein BKA67DRAFT_594100 [Truncatella angustata]